MGRNRSSRKKILRSIRDVTITLKAVSDLEYGCRVVPAISAPSTQFEPDDYYDYFDEPPFYRFNQYRFHPRP